MNWIKRLVPNILSDEQAEQLTDLAERVKGRAVERKCIQELRVVFNENGHPRQFSGTDNVKPIAPKTYRAE